MGEYMRLTLSIKVSTLAGLECSISVVREQRVSDLCDEIALQFGIKAYRLILAHANGRLEPRSATLEECGVTGPECELGASLGEIDPLKEMTLAQFLDLVVRHRLATQLQSDDLLTQVETKKL